MSRSGFEQCESRMQIKTIADWDNLVDNVMTVMWEELLVTAVVVIVLCYRLSVVIVLCCYLCCSVIIVFFYVLIVCTVTLPPGVNPIAVDKYIYLEMAYRYLWQVPVFFKFRSYILL